MNQTNKNNNLKWFDSYVSREDREKLHGHKGAVVWFTGLSASGKSTIAHLAEKELHKRGCSTYVLDGDNIRHGLCSDLGFSPEDRAENIRRIGEVVKLFVDAGIIVLTAFISPYQKDRERVKRLFSKDQFIEVYVNCPLEICETRDKKGFYKKAKKGLIKEYTGVSSPYEPPKNPDIVIHSYKQSPLDCARQIISILEKRGIINVSKRNKRR